MGERNKEEDKVSLECGRGGGGRAEMNRQSEKNKPKHQSGDRKRWRINSGEAGPDAEQMKTEGDKVEGERSGEVELNTEPGRKR